MVLTPRQVKMEDGLWEAVGEAAHEARVSRSEWVRRVLEAALDWPGTGGLAVPGDLLGRSVPVVTGVVKGTAGVGCDHRFAAGASGLLVCSKCGEVKR